MKQLLILLVLVFTLAACGPGTGGVGGTPLPTYYAFFVSKTNSSYTLNAFGPNAFGYGTITTIPTTQLTYQAGLYTGAFDPQTQMTSGLSQSGVLFIDNGQIKSVSSDLNSKLQVQQHSSFSGTICSQPELTNNYLVFTTPQSGATCNSSTDLVKAVTTSMSSTDTAYTLPAVPIVLFNGYTSAIGILYVSSNTLYYANPNGQTPKQLQTGVTSVSEMASAGNTVLLNIDGTVQEFNETTDSLSGTLYTASNTLGYAVSDGTNYYFFDGANLDAISVSGGGFSQLATVPTTTNDVVQAAFVSNNYLVYTVSNTVTVPKQSAIYSINLSNLNVTQLKSVSSPTVLKIVGFAGSELYYQVSLSGSNNQTGDVAAAVQLDGSHLQQWLGAAWVGYTYAQSFYTPEGKPLSTVTLQQYTFNGLGVPTGGTVSVFDASTDTLLSKQGNLPSGIVSYSGIGYGTDVFGQFLDANGNAFLSYLVTNLDYTLQQIDNITAPVYDTPIL